MVSHTDLMREHLYFSFFGSIHSGKVSFGVHSKNVYQDALISAESAISYSARNIIKKVYWLRPLEISSKNFASQNLRREAFLPLGILQTTKQSVKHKKKKKQATKF